MNKKRQSTDAKNEVPKGELELSDKGFKAAISKILQEAIRKMIKTNEKIESSRKK